jgi:small subunit ribosomal protein S16
MLAIRLQRLGRKGYPVYRVAVQEAQRHPSSGRVVAYVGSYNPHNKEAKFDTEKVNFYLKNGAQPTPRVVRLLKEAKVKLPGWVSDQSKKSASIKNPEKLRKNQPAEPEPPKEEAEAPVENETAAEPEAPEVKAEESKAEDVQA